MKTTALFAFLFASSPILALVPRVLPERSLNIPTSTFGRIYPFVGDGQGEERGGVGRAEHACRAGGDRGPDDLTSSSPPFATPTSFAVQVIGRSYFRWDQIFRSFRGLRVCWYVGIGRTEVARIAPKVHCLLLLCLCRLLFYRGPIV